MKIIKLKPFIADYMWGGHRLCDTYGLEPSQIAAEAWVFSAHADGQSILAEGDDAGMPFGEWLKTQKDVFGKKAKIEPGFGAPILCKFIDAERSLSIQVHPDDAFARQHENSPGKTEMWYILDAAPGAYIYYGLKEDVTADQLREGMSSGRITEMLNKVYVKPGEAFFIEAGTVHAIGAGILICEIQQSSNVTYRMYDFGRLGTDGKPRALHIDKAAACTRLTASAGRSTIEELPCESGKAELLAECGYFRSVKYTLQAGETLRLCADEESFLSLIAVSGNGRIAAGEEADEVGFGDSFFVPAGAGEVVLTTDSELGIIVSEAGRE